MESGPQQQKLAITPSDALVKNNSRTGSRKARWDRNHSNAGATTWCRPIQTTTILKRHKISTKTEHVKE